MSTNISSWQRFIAPHVPKAPLPAIDTMVLLSLIELCEKSLVWTKRLTTVEIVAGTSRYALTSSDGSIAKVTEARIDDIPLTPLGPKYVKERVSSYRSINVGVPTVFFVENDRYINLVYNPSDDSDAYVSCTDLTFSADDLTITSDALVNFETEGFEAGQRLLVQGSDYNDEYLTIESVDEGEITVSEPLVDEGTADASAILSVGGLDVFAALSPLATATTVEDFLFNDFVEPVMYGALYRLMDMPGKDWYNPQGSDVHRRRFFNGLDKAKKMANEGLTLANTGFRA